MGCYRNGIRFEELDWGLGCGICEYVQWSAMHQTPGSSPLLSKRSFFPRVSFPGKNAVYTWGMGKGEQGMGIGT